MEEEESEEKEKEKTIHRVGSVQGREISSGREIMLIHTVTTQIGRFDRWALPQSSL